MIAKKALKKTGKICIADNSEDYAFVNSKGVLVWNNNGDNEPVMFEYLDSKVWQPYSKERGVERIVLEEVVWQKHEDRHWEIVYPQTGMTVEEEQRFIDAPPMKMILEIPKEATNDQEKKGT